MTFRGGPLMWYSLLGGVGGLPLRQERVTFNTAARSPAALRERTDSKPNGPSSPEEFLFLRDKLGSQKWHEGLCYCPISAKMTFRRRPLKFENVLTVRPPPFQSADLLFLHNVNQSRTNTLTTGPVSKFTAAARTRRPLTAR